jgi:hypothetical protein
MKTSTIYGIIFITGIIVIQNLIHNENKKDQIKMQKMKLQNKSELILNQVSQNRMDAIEFKHIYLRSGMEQALKRASECYNKNDSLFEILNEIDKKIGEL